MKQTRWIGAVLVVTGLAFLGNVFAFTTIGDRWARAALPVGYFTNPAGTVAGWEASVQAGAQAWNNVPNQYFRFAWRGQTARMAESIDGVNAVSNMINPSNYQAGVLAVTYGWSGGNGYSEFGTAFKQTHPWSTNNSPSTFDVQSVGCHELGHALGLGHSAVAVATMFYATGPNELFRRTLEPDDQQGEQFLYPGGVAAGVTVSGTVRETNGAGAANVLVTATINGVQRTFTTTSTGVYSFASVPQGTLSLVPSRASTAFTPANRAVQVGASNIGGQDFTATAAPSAVTVSGRVTNPGGSGIANVTVTATINGATRTFVTDAAGNFWFLRVPQGTLRLTPSRLGLSFTPAFRQFAVGASNIAGQNFVGQ